MMLVLVLLVLVLVLVLLVLLLLLVLVLVLVLTLLSQGDWGLVHSAAVVAEGTEGFTMQVKNNL